MMRLFRHQSEVEGISTSAVVALGNFDGFHRGHQVVIGEAGRIARMQNVPLAVVVTEPHPVTFFRKDVAPFRLTPFRERAQMLEAFGVDILLVLPFDAALAGTKAEDFVNQVVIGALKASHVVVGFDYRFGTARRGDTNLLKQLGQQQGFGVSVIDAVTVGIDGNAGDIYSSTLVREALQKGKPRRAAALLGHWWTISGRVVHGDARGRTIGFPTANLELGERLEPKHGVYAVRAYMEEEGGVPGDRPVHLGVANLGRRPTFDKRDVVLEVHLFDFDGDLYGKHLHVELVSFLRPEQKFNGLDALKVQIDADAATARTVLSDPENARHRLAMPRLEAYLSLYKEPHSCALQGGTQARP